MTLGLRIHSLQIVLAKILGGWEPVAGHVQLSPRCNGHSRSLGPCIAWLLQAAALEATPEGCAGSGVLQAASPGSSAALSSLQSQATLGWTPQVVAAAKALRDSWATGVPTLPAAQEIVPPPCDYLGQLGVLTALSGLELGAGTRGGCNQAKAAAEVPLSQRSTTCTLFPLPPFSSSVGVSGGNLLSHCLSVGKTHTDKHRHHRKPTKL